MAVTAALSLWAGGSSYINAVVLRDKDANTAWTSASDGVLEERYYFCQNWRGDVSAMVNSGRKLAEWAKYSSYGIPIGLPGADTDSDGDCDSADISQIQAWIDTSAYDVRGDVDLDGDIDSADKTIAENNVQGISLGWGSLSARGNIVGYAGGLHSEGTVSVLYRSRVLLGALGIWSTRDSREYHDGLNMNQGLRSSPLIYVDPHGTNCTIPAPGGGAPGSGGGSGATPIGGGHPGQAGQGNTGAPYVSPENCCDRLGKKPAASGKGAGIACCDGELTVCVWNPNNWPDGGGPVTQALNACMQEHEDAHKKQIEEGRGGGFKCDESKGEYLPTWEEMGFNPTSSSYNEMRGSGSEIECLKDIDCSTMPDPEQCEEWVQERIDQMKEYWNWHRKNMGGTSPIFEPPAPDPNHWGT